MKKILFSLIVFLVFFMVPLSACSCSSGYKNYDDFSRNASPKEIEGFYDWWSRNP